MIVAKGVSKRFDNFTALDKVSCMIPEGCIYGMVGTNGAGKSTFLRLLTGVYKPEEGTISYDGEGVYENVRIKGQIAYIPDELYFMSGASMDRMAKLYRAVYDNFDVERYRMLTKNFRLDTKKSISAFSKGMKRQAAIILALSCKPKYMFFDETFDGLDPVMRNLVKGIICQDVEERKATAIITSHSLRELEDTCDQLSLLHQGGLVLESDITGLRTNLFKVQTAFLDEYDKSRFDRFNILHFSKHGSVSNIIVKGDREETVAGLAALHPVILDVLPLTLEEVFTYELEALGYEFSGIFENEEERGNE